MRKNFARIATIIGLSTVLSVNVFATTFTDVPATHWAYTDISYMQSMGYMTKTSSGDFLPNEKVSYFDMAIILAKATGYIDEVVDKNMDETLKQQIRDNYEKQLPTIQSYSSKYTLWENSANEEIAYLLGTGVINESDLSRFVLKTATGLEVENALTKQDLAAMLVRFIGKEGTAINDYTTTGFSDESLIRTNNRPHVAYLKENGIVSGNASGEFGANDQMTRAQVATMVRRAITHKAQVNPTPAPTPEKDPVEESTPVETPTTVEATINKIVPKTDTDYYILLEMNGVTKFYTATETVEIRDQAGSKLGIEDLAVDMSVKAVVGEEDNIDKVFQVLIQETVAQQPSQDKEEGQEELEEDREEDREEEQSYTGEVDRIGRNGDVTIYTSKGSITHVLAEDVEIIYNGEVVNVSALNVGDMVEVEVKAGEIVAIEILHQMIQEPESVEAEFISYVRYSSNYEVLVEEDGEEESYTIDSQTDVIRNGDYSDWDELRKGDALTFTYEEGAIILVEAESEEVEWEGTLQSILLAVNPEVTITTKDGAKTVAVTADTEIYDSKSREDITLRDLMIGAEVEVTAESKEAISIISKEVPDTMSYKGVIEKVGSGATYIEVLVDYEPLTGETKVLKTVNVPSGVDIIIDNEESYRKKLEEGMEVLVKYNYGETMYPLSIQVID